MNEYYLNSNNFSSDKCTVIVFNKIVMGKPVKCSKHIFIGNQFVTRSIDAKEATKVQGERRGRPLKASLSARPRTIIERCC